MCSHIFPIVIVSAEDKISCNVRYWELSTDCMLLAYIYNIVKLIKVRGHYIINTGKLYH